MDFPWDKKDKSTLHEQLKAHLDKPVADSGAVAPESTSSKLVKINQEIKTMGYWDTHPLFDEAQLTSVTAFVPEFRTVYGTGTGNDGKSISWPMNSDYFASQTTAQWIANKFGDGKVYEAPFFQNGPFMVSAAIYLTKLKDGRLVNTGILASYYVRNPEDKFPGLAEKLIRAQLGI